MTQSSPKVGRMLIGQAGNNGSIISLANV